MSTVEMKLLFCAALALVLVQVAISEKEGEEKCFKKFEKTDWRNKIKAKLEGKFKGLINDCKASNQSADEKAIKKCCKDKFKAAMKECKADKTTSKRECMRQKLHIENNNSTKSDKNISKEEIKEKIMNNLINENKKEAINTAIAVCNDAEGRQYWMCCLEEISKGPCPEVKSFMDKVVAFKAKMDKWRGKKGGKGKGKGQNKSGNTNATPSSNDDEDDIENQEM